jgi:dCMP deaminase
MSLDKCACSHGEENAIVHAALHGMNTNGATLYTTNTPCTTCAKMIINAGIKKIVSGAPYADALGAQLLKEAKVELQLLNENSSTTS